MLSVDGLPVAFAQPVIGTPIHHGSRLELVAADDLTARPTAGGGVIDLVWVTGPDAGRATTLGVGRHLLGRAPGSAVRCEDRALEVHHAVIEISGSGGVSLVQLAGLQPITVVGPDVTSAEEGDGEETIEGSVQLRIGARIAVGASVLEVRPPSASAATTLEADRVGTAARSSVVDTRADPWRSPWVRSPRPVRTFDPEPVEVPRPNRVSTVFGGAITPTLLGLAGAALMAVLFGQVMFLMFGALGALVAFGTWGAQKLGVVRSRRSADRADDEALAEFHVALERQRATYEAVHRDRVPTLAASIAALSRRSPSLWAVRAEDPGAFTVSIGEGDVLWEPRVRGTDRDTSAETWAAIERAGHLTRMPVAASLADGTVTAIVGGQAAYAVARSMLLQLATASGPADWQLAVISDRAAEWDALGWLPHIDDVGRVPLIGRVAEHAEVISRLDGDARHLVVVIDQPDLLASRTSALRRLVAGGRSIAVVVVCRDEAAMPAIVTSALVVGRSTARWIVDTRATALADVVRIAGMSAASAFDAAASMAGLTDPEFVSDSAGIPKQVGLIELLDEQLGRNPVQDARRISAGWHAAGRDPAPATPIGVASDGVVEIDLVADGPHGLLAGTTGAGKSELLRSLVVGLATRCSPDHITFVLVDYKGGSTFDACASLPHVVGVVTDLDDRLAARALRSLEAELRRRETLLREAGAVDLAAYRTSAVLPRLVVVVDEFAALAVQQPAFIGALLGVAQRGRSLGVHLLLATQRPNGVISDDIRANTNLRVALRVQDRSDALDVIGDPAAANLPRSTPGRALMRLGADDTVMFQTARCSGPAAGVDGGRTELEVLVTAIRSAAEIAGIAAPHRPWLPALGSPPSDLLPGESVLPPSCFGAVGVLDDPDGQRRTPLRWRPVDGHLLLAGSAGSGTTSALLALATSLAGVDDPVELFVLDAMGDRRLSLLHSLPGCAAVVRLHETERLMRVLAALQQEIARRKADHEAAARHEIVVMIDGIAPLRAELDALDLHEPLSRLDGLVTDGRSVGISVVMTTSTITAVPSRLLGQIAQRWVFHLDDALDAGVLGISSASVPGEIPGRIVDARSGLEGQIDAFAESLLLDLACRGRSAPPSVAGRDLSALRDDIDVDEMPAGRCDGPDCDLPIGASYDTLQPIALPVASGEHVMVLGPARSGRTTAVETIVHCWQLAHPGGWVGSISVRRSSARVGSVFDGLATALAALHAHSAGRRLLVIDDAELVDDPGGALAALIDARAEGITVVAAGRPDSLRGSYGHWTAAVRRSRLGLVMASAADIDGDLLHVALPRRLPIPARPGLAWLVADGQRQLIQLARRSVT